MGHVKLKPTREVKINFHPSELDENIVPEESKKIAKEYLKSKKLAENENFDLLMMLEDKVIVGYDYLYKGKKIILPEVS